MILEASREQRLAVDWELIADYLRLFHLENRLPELKEWHGHADQD